MNSAYLLESRDCGYLQEESVVFDNKISIGKLGQPPSREKKIIDKLSKNLISLPYSSLDKNEWANHVRAIFLNFFVAILGNYQKFLNYHDLSGSEPEVIFKSEDYIKSQAPDSRLFFRKLVHSQAFTVFAYECALKRCGRGQKKNEVHFIDEKIVEKKTVNYCGVY
jgi:hypothetical protein